MQGFSERDGSGHTLASFSRDSMDSVLMDM
jgi:hypothetical protein